MKWYQNPKILCFAGGVAAALVGLVYLLVRRNKYDENTLSSSAVAAAAK